MPSLRILRDGAPVAEYRLRAGRTTLGRADSCDIALPEDTISRLHCQVVVRGDGPSVHATVHDRSRHGTRLDGEVVPPEGAPLADGACIELGQYRLQYVAGTGDSRSTAMLEPEQRHEQVIASDGARIAVERAAIEVHSGPGAGARHLLRESRVSLGAAGSGLVLPDPLLVRDHVWLRVSRGRVMLEPGRGPTWIDGDRLRDITPVYADEEFRIGSTVLRTSRDEALERPMANQFGDLVGDSAVMRQLFGTLRRMAAHHYTMLVIGESGTGKELIARGVHENSSRADRAFVALNCGAITPSLFESELFGHEKGAFTGADRQRDGAFHEADGGTLFLDEVGELPEEAQAKLLRALETGEVRRVGSAEVRFPDVRVVAATNRELEAEVRRGAFRADLYFRLAVLQVRVPPLRERLQDLDVICKLLCRQLHKEVHLTDEARVALRRHSWPGNVRELRNVLTRAYVLGGPRIDATHLSFHPLAAPTPLRAAEGAEDAAERTFLTSLDQRHGGNRSAMARELGVARSTLHYKLKKHGLM
jgi:DNA-binding NtrC family response regulator